MKRNLLRALKFKPNFSSMTIRGRNEWDSYRAYPHTHLDEHVEPAEEEIIQEIFDKNYYHYINKARNADAHGEEDKFIKYRMWQHLYVTPKDPFLTEEHGSPLTRHLMLFLPAILAVSMYWIFPNYKKLTHNRKHIFGRLSTHN